MIDVDGLSFRFPKEWTVLKWDDTAFQKRFQKTGVGTKSCDLVAMAPKGDVVWLIEVKDYRQHKREKSIDLCEEIGCKARDTLAALWSAQRNANAGEEREFAAAARKRMEVRVALHLEGIGNLSKLMPKNKFEADLAAKLKQNLHALDPHPVLTSIAEPRHVPWSVR